MQLSDFEALKLSVNEKISVLDLKGGTHYGAYTGQYDPKVPSFGFIEKDTTTEKVISKKPKRYIVQLV